MIRNYSFTREFYYSRIADETVGSLACDSTRTKTQRSNSPLTSLFNIVWILLILEKKEGWIDVDFDSSTDYDEAVLRLNHSSGRV